MNYFFDNFFPTNIFDDLFVFKKWNCQVPQWNIAQQAESSCDVKIGNLQGLKASSGVLLDNFLNILDRMNLKCGMY